MIRRGRGTICPQNLALHSDDLSNAYWGPTGVTATGNQIANPIDGTVNAALIAEAATTGAPHTQFNAVPAGLGSGTPYTLSLYLKNNTRRWAGLRSGSSIGHEATFDLQNGTISAQQGLMNVSIQPLPNGWYRCSISFLIEGPVGASIIGQFPFLSNNGGFYTAYDGDITKSVYAYGGQYTIGSAPTQYVSSVLSAVNSTALPQIRSNRWINHIAANLVGAVSFSGWSPSHATLVPTSGINPVDGLNTAWSMTEDVSSGQSHLALVVAVGGVGGVLSGYQLTSSIYAKAGSRHWLAIGGSGGAEAGWFDLQNGVLGTQSGGTGTITALANGWYRCSFTYTSTGASSSTMVLYSTTGDGTTGYDSNGSSSLLLFNPQLNYGSAIL